jgi:hypothetical protein
MIGDPPIDLRAVIEPRDETTTARGSFPLVNRAFRIVERL